MIQVGIIGVGGFAASHHKEIQVLENQGQCRLVCTCDPDSEALQQASSQGDWEKRGVQVYSDYRAMIEENKAHLDVITIPAPISLHAEMHRACIENGIACYLEKPPTLDPEELERMIAVDARAKRETQVAFNFIVEPLRQALKERILSGEFGAIRRVSFTGLWPRPTSYYQRNNWAGKLFSPDNRLLLDSCIGNAMAHYVHNLLFWAGDKGLFSFATPAQVTAELYRGHAIETFDTAFVRAKCANGVEVWIGCTHACSGKGDEWERIECEKATIYYKTYGTYTITSKEGELWEQGATNQCAVLRENFATYFSYVQGNFPRPLTRLSDSRPYVQLNGLTYVAAGHITPVAKDSVTVSEDSTGKTYREIHGICEACREFTETGRFPTQQGREWARTGASKAELADLSRLRSVATDIQSSL